MRKTALTAVLMLVPYGAAQAQTSQWTCNANGAAFEAPNGQTIYLGNSCDAARSDGVEGDWWYAASAWLVQFQGEGAQRFAFEIPCEITYCLHPNLR